MNTRDRAPLSDIPRLAPESDEVTKHRPAIKASQIKAGSSPSPAPKQGAVGFAYFVFFVVCAFMGIAWYGWQLQQQLVTANQQLSLAQERLASINSALSVTDASFAESGNALNARFKDIDFEILKLWNLANKSNKKRITANEAQLITDKKDIAGLKQSVQRFDQVARTTQGLYESYESNLTAMNASLEAMQDQLDELEANVANGNVQQTGLIKAVSAVADAHKQLKKNVATMQQRVKGNEQSVEAIDSSRAQTNQRLVKLKSQLNRLESDVVKFHTSVAQ